MGIKFHGSFNPAGALISPDPMQYNTLLFPLKYFKNLERGSAVPQTRFSAGKEIER